MSLTRPSAPFVRTPFVRVNALHVCTDVTDLGMRVVYPAPKGKKEGKGRGGCVVA